ncbi:MAG: FecR family protein [Myxococcota bacterium]
MNYAEWTRRSRDHTAPTSLSVARVRGRLDRQLVPAHELTGLPVPGPDAAARVRARLRQPAPAPDRSWTAPLTAFALVAAAGLVVIAVADREPAPVDRFLAGTGTDQRIGDHVVVRHDGRGHVSASGDDVAIDWEFGRIALDVEPNRGVRLAVNTPEVAVRVVGTKFSVERDALGTRVEVERGKVAVTCTSGTEQLVTASEAVECEPVTAPGLLNRARALDAAHTAPDTILATVDRGLAVVGGDAAVRGELLTVKSSVLVAAGRLGDALDAAEAALATNPDDARATALHRTAAHLALLGEDCDRAVAHLGALPSLTADEQGYLARCE